MSWNRAREIAWAVIFTLICIAIVVDTFTFKLAEDYCGESTEQEQGEN